jgi:hypothetical protein
VGRDRDAGFHPQLKGMATWLASHDKRFESLNALTNTGGNASMFSSISVSQ